MRFKNAKKAALAILLVLFVLMTAGLIFWLSWEPFYIPSPSMQPSLLTGDLVWVHKTISKSDLNVGDVIVFHSSQDQDLYIKRIVGKAGDRVRILGNQLFVNDVLISHTPQLFEKRATRTSCDVLLKPTPDGAVATSLKLPYAQAYKNYTYFEEDLNGKKHWVQFDSKKTSHTDGEWLVPEDSYFVLGDNRTNSIDSRQHGFVKSSEVVGKAHSVWFSVTSKLYACGPQYWSWMNLYLRATRGGLEI